MMRESVERLPMSHLQARRLQRAYRWTRFSILPPVLEDRMIARYERKREQAVRRAMQKRLDYYLMDPWPELRERIIRKTGDRIDEQLQAHYDQREREGQIRMSQILRFMSALAVPGVLSERLALATRALIAIGLVIAYGAGAIMREVVDPVLGGEFARIIGRELREGYRTLQEMERGE